MEHNIEYDNELKYLVENHPVHFTRMIRSTGFHKNKNKDRRYLLKYVEDMTPQLSDPFYTLKTKVYWVLNNITEFPKCHNNNCEHPEMIKFNVRKMKEGYTHFCSRKCMYSSNEWKEKVNSGFIEKYGVKNYFMTKEFSDRMKTKQSEVQKKKDSTKRNNKSFNISEKEEEAYRLLSSKYGEQDIERQYSTDIRYPFACDFYIKSLDLFIEYNGSWTHGTHPFDENNKNDIEILNLWKNKDTPFYKNAIETWTKRDVKKRNIALSNNLKFKEFWNLTSLRKFLGIETKLTDNLIIQWNRKRAEYEYNYFKNKNLSELPSTTSKNNYIIKYFQQDTFFRNEKDIWKNDPIKKEKLLSNRLKYIDKSPEDLTVDDILTGFKKSGIYYGYSHFNPLWFKWFNEKYNVKSCYDPCGGWGHRLLGALNLEQYIYNDLSISTKNNIERIIKYFKIKNTKTFNNDARNFIPEDNFDAMFTCPPYFNVEKYECEEFKDKNDFDKFLNSLFDVFHNKESCKIFGLVIREDLLGNHNDYSEKYLINENKESYFDEKKNTNNEYLFVFKNHKYRNSFIFI